MSDEDDTRILNMRINNKEFLKGTADSVKALDNVNKAVDNAGKGRGLQSMAKNVDTVKTRFGAMQIAGVTAIANLSNRAVNAGLRMASALTLDPIKAGFKEYQLGLNSIQAIMAATDEPIGKVNAELDKLNAYSDKTIYNFGEMVSSVKTFTNAGIKLKDATTMVKGFSNEAAVSGTNAQQAAGAAYQLSQAINNGVVKLQDWKSLTNANMGNAKMRDGLIQIADAMGTFKNSGTSAEEAQKHFNQTLEKGWLSSKVMTNYLKIQAGEMSSAELKTLGLSKAQISYFQKAAKTAQDSATKIKTFPQMMDVIKESIGSGWAGIFRALFGNLTQSIKIWTTVGNKITGVISGMFDSVQSMLFVWQQAKGFEKTWEAIGNIFQALGNILRPFLVLLDALSPGTNSAGSAMVGMTDAFLKFSIFLEKVTRGTSYLEPVMRLLGTAIHFVFVALGQVLKAGGPIAQMFAAIGEAIGNFAPLQKVLAQGRDIANNLIRGLQEGLDSGAIQEAIGRMVTNMVEYFKGLLGIHSPSTVFAEFGKNIVQGLVNGLLGAVQLVGEAIAWIGESLLNFDKYDFANVFSVVFGGAALYTVMKFVRQMGQAMSNFSGFANQIMNPKDGLIAKTKDTMGSFQNSLRAKALLSIALAIGVLAVSLWILSKIPADKLATGMLAITAMMYQMMGVMKAMSAGAVTTKTAIASITAMAFAMGLMAGAVLLLSTAILAFGLMPTGVLVKGMVAVGIALGMLTGMALLLSKASPWLIAAGAATVLMSAALLVLAAALTAMSAVILIYDKIDWKDLLNGLAKMAVTLIALGIAMIPLSAMAPLLLIASAALIVLSVGLTAMAGVIGIFSKISWDTIISGVSKIAAALIALGLAGLVAAPGLIALGAAAVLIGIGLLAAGAGMALFGAGLAAVAAAGVAAAAVLITAIEGFLAILPLIAVQLVAALTAFLEAVADNAPEMVDAFVTIGREILRGLSELSQDIADTGLEILTSLVNAIVDSRQIFFDAGFDLVEGFLQTIRDRMPELLELGTDIVVEFITGVGAGAEEITIAAGETILSFLTALDTAVQTYAQPIAETGRSIGFHLIQGLILGLIPEPIRTAFTNLVNNILDFFRGLLGINSPSTVFSGFGRDIVMGLIQGIGSLVGSIGGVMSRVGNAVVNGIRSGLKIAASAVTSGIGKMVSAFGSLPGKILAVAKSVGSAAKEVGAGIINGIGKGIGGAKNWISNMSGQLKAAINKGLGLPKEIGFSKKLFGKTVSAHITIPGFARGVTGFGGGAALVGEAGPEIVTMGRGSNVITNENLIAFMKQVSRLTRALASGKSKNSPGGSIQYVVSADFKGDPKATGVEFAANLTNGLVNGLRGNQYMVNTAMAGVGTEMSQSFMDVLGINSPSKVFMEYAKFVGQGFINGLVYSADGVAKAASAMGNAAISAIAKTVTDGQIKLEAIRGQANAYADAADELRAKAKRTKSKKEKRRLLAEAKALDKKARAQQKLSDAQAKKVEAENEAAERKEAFANADNQGKSEIRKEDAITAASNASKAREAAIRLSKEADLVRKYDKKRAAEIDKAAQLQLEKSKEYADQANQYAKESYDLAILAGSGVTGAVGGPTAMTDELVAAAQASFNEYTKLLADAQAEALKDTPPSEVKFEQNNYSPEAISPAEAYRNGKSLVSVMERKLTDPDN